VSNIPVGEISPNLVTLLAKAKMKFKERRREGDQGPI
jgi:hypothetical protein